MTDIPGVVRNADSWSVTEVKAVTHNHCWTIKGFSKCDVRYLETSTKVKDLSQIASYSGSQPFDTPHLLFKIRLHPQGNKESNKDFTFFQCFSSNPNTPKATFKFTVLNSKGEEIPTTIYTGTQQLHGYFEYIRRDALVSHLLPRDELILNIELSVTFDMDTKACSLPKFLLSPEPNQHEVCNDLGFAFKNGTHSDFLIIVEGKEIPVHKAILISRSPVFKAMLQSHTKEAKNGKAVINDISYDIMYELMTYLYTGKSANIHKMAIELLAAADRYSLPGLKTMSEQVLRSALSTENVCRCLIHADLYNASELKTDSIKFIASNIHQVVETDGWQEVSRDLMTDIILTMSSGKRGCPFSSNTISYCDQPPIKRIRIACTSEPR